MGRHGAGDGGGGGARHESGAGTGVGLRTCLWVFLGFRRDLLSKSVLAAYYKHMSIVSTSLELCHFQSLPGSEPGFPLPLGLLQSLGGQVSRVPVAAVAEDIRLKSLSQTKIQ